MADIIPDGWRLLTDGEVIEDGDMGFGMCSNGRMGWGKMPKWMIGQSFCEHSATFPGFMARKLTEENRHGDKAQESEISDRPAQQGQS